MATTSNRLTDLYREALDSVTAIPENWLRFLQSAGRNYRYPFQDQLLIHHQRPDAIAVLEFSQWERRFHRGIRRGSTGIAVFGRSNGRTQVRYLFDIQDTNERTNSIPVPLWNVESGDHGPLLHMLEQKFSATEPVLPIAVMTTAKQYTSAVVSLRWEELQKAQVPVTQDALERLVENSVAYLLLCRMGLEDYAIFYPQDFDALEQFRTPQNIHLLGDVVNMASRDILTEVAATVRAEHLGQPTFFAEDPKTVYDEPTTKTNSHEGGQNHDDDLSCINSPDFWAFSNSFANLVFSFGCNIDFSSTGNAASIEFIFRCRVFCYISFMNYCKCLDCSAPCKKFFLTLSCFCLPIKHWMPTMTIPVLIILKLIFIVLAFIFNI